MLVGARAHRFKCVKNYNASWFFTLNSFPVCIKNGPPPKGHPANLTQLWEALKSTWASIPVERFPCPDELRLFGGQKGEQLNIPK